MAIPLEKWNFIEKTLRKLKEERDRFNEVTDGLLISPESPLMEPLSVIEELLVASLDRMISDDSTSIEYFVYECKFGSIPHKAGVGDNLREIRTPDDLHWLIDL